MQLRRGHIAGLAGFGDHLATLYRVAALDGDFAGVGVGSDEAVAVAHEDEIAVALQFVAGIRDHAVFRGLDRGAFGHGEIDAVVLQTVRLRSKTGDDTAAHRPTKRWRAANGFRALDRAFLALGRNRRGKPCAMGRVRARDRADIAFAAWRNSGG